jgi:2-succinyl-5-enolpyruvyl-6-hydroxy-3-cyclohexene-1-carboxylate synthase
MAPREGLRALANRGASGIDGLVSTALGIAAGGPGPTVALLGDLSFLYDLGTVAWNARRGLDATVVVVRNGGGELFSQLPQAELPERELFVTPHGADLAALSLATGAGHRLVEHADAVGPALTDAVRDGGIQVVEVAVDAAGAGALRAGMGAALAAAVG